MMDPDGIVETMKRSILPPVIPNEISFSGMVQSTGNDGSFIAKCLYLPKDMCTIRRQYCNF